MLDTLVSAVAYDQNPTSTFMGMINLMVDGTTYGQSTGHRDNPLPTNQVEQWLCEARDTVIVVDNMSRQFPGREIKVFNLSEVHIRPPGELVSKVVTKDGVLPF